MDDNKKNKEKKISYIFTKETFGMTLLLFCVIVFIMLLTRGSVFAGIGRGICTLMYGTFGYGSWLLLGMLAYLGEWLVFGKKIRISFKKAFTIALTAFMLFLLFHTVSTNNYTLDGYGKYIANCYKNAALGWSGYTCGGVFSAIFVYPLFKLSPVAAYIIFSVLVLGCGYLTFLAFRGGFRSKQKPEKAAVPVRQPEVISETSATDNSVAVTSEVSATVYEEPLQQKAEIQNKPEADKNDFSQKNLGRKILFENGEFAAESYRRNMIFNENSYFNKPSSALASEADYLSSFSSGGVKPSSAPEKSYSESYREEIYNSPAKATPSNYVYGEKPVEELDVYNSNTNDAYDSTPSVQPAPAYPFDEPANDYPAEETSYVSDSRVAEPEQYREPSYYMPEEPAKTGDDPYIPPVAERNVGFSPVAEPVERQEEYRPALEEKATEEKKEESNPDIYKLFGSSVRGESRDQSMRTRSNAELFDGEDEEDNSDELDVFGRNVRDAAVKRDNTSESRSIIEPRRVERTEKAEEKAAPAPSPQPAEEKPKHIWKKYVRPSLDLLDDYPENTNVNTGEIEDSKRTIIETLDRFKIAAEVSNVTIGPAITRYDVIIQDKTNIKRSLNYREAIAMELRKENVTAYLNYSKGALSIEVPNNKRTVVGLKTMLANSKFLNSKPNSLTFGLGKNVEGEVVCPDITKMPHLLVAGTTGSGKSICLSALLISLLYKYGPEELRLILVDPKQVEFISYDKLPHLMINEILYECDKAIKALNWAIKEMERRYSLFKDMTEAGQATKNLDEYNAHLPAGEEKLPKILIVLDEFGDLMLQAKKDIESRIIKLVQKARACGIHLILATQRPSVDCITGLIKSNLPTRIGFKVNSFDDARTIFDIGGAEKLLGRGDMYFRSAENPDLTRIQGCFVDTHEVQKVTDFIKANNETYFDQTVSDFINTVEHEETSSSVGGGDMGEDGGETKIDDTFIKALKYCVTSNQASVSMIQRRFPVGYIKACKIIDWMENMNYITQSEGSKPRKVLLSKDEFENIYGDDIDD